MKSLPILLILVAINFISIKNTFSMNLHWQRAYGGSSRDESYSIITNSNGNFVFIGETASIDGDVTDTLVFGNDVWLVEIDSTGNIIRNNCIGLSFGISEAGYSITQTMDHGYAFCGRLVNGPLHGSPEDFWVVKLDSLWNIQWQRCVGGYNSDRSRGIIQTSDNKFLIIGETDSNNGDVHGNHGGGRDMLVSKLDENGQLLWVKCYGGSNWDEGISCAESADQNYFLAGSTSSTDSNITCNSGGQAAWVLKTDTAGNILWDRCYGGSANDWSAQIIASSDTGFYFGGTSMSNDGDVSGNYGGADFWLFKANSSGDIQWQRSLGGPGSESAHAMYKTSDEGFVMAGEAFSDGGLVSGVNGYHDYWIVKTDSIGNYLWSGCFGGSQEDEPKGITESNSGHILVTGITQSNDSDVTNYHGNFDCWIIDLYSNPTAVTEIIPSFHGLMAYAGNNEINVSFQASTPERLTISLTNILSQELFTTKIKSNAGINNFIINSFSAKPGVYFLNVSGNDYRETIKIFID